MTMRVMGIRGELTGKCLSVRDRGFTMEVDGEDFGADVTYWRLDPAQVRAGTCVFVVGRISFREFDARARRVLVQAERVDVLDPPEERPPSSGLVDRAKEPTIEEIAVGESATPAAPRGEPSAS